MDKFNRFFRYLYDPEPMNDSTEPIICLAQVYADDESNGSPTSTGARPWPIDFLRDHEARLWFTYRTGFEKILRDTKDTSIGSKLQGAGFTADTGFGCMIRSAQTLLANTLLTLELGRDWRRGLRRDVEARVLRLFADDARAPYSVHNFIEHGAEVCDKPAGQWFGPNAASLCISALSLKCPDSRLRVYVAAEQGGTVYEDSVLEIARSEANFAPVLILIPQRLGHAKINPRYHGAVLSLFAVPQFMGIAGGRPSSAHYFFARQGEKLFFLDPHFPRNSLPFHEDLAKYDEEDFDGVHTTRVRRMSLEDMDPSMLIGFLIKDEEDWQKWKATMGELPGKLRLATITESTPSFGRVDSDVESRESEVFSDGEGLQ